MSERTKYLIETGIPRAVYGKRREIEREAHTLAVQQLADVDATVPEVRSWAFDVRRGRMTVYGGILRFIDVLYRKGVSKRVALMIPGWIAEYIEQLWSDEPAAPAVIPTLVSVTGEIEKEAA